MLREFKVDATVGKPQVAYRETITKTVEKVEIPLRHARPAAGASTATSSSTSSPPAPAAATSSSTRSPAASSPRSTSPRSTTASRRRCRPACSPATRWSTCGPRSRRLVPRRRLLGDGVQDRRLDGVQGGGPQGQARAARADHGGRGRHARGLHGRRHRRPQQPGGARSRAWSSGATARSSGRRCPLSEMFGYATDLRSRTQGRATYTMQFHSYQQVPSRSPSEIVARVRGE